MGRRESDNAGVRIMTDGYDKDRRDADKGADAVSISAMPVKAVDRERLAALFREEEDKFDDEEAEEEPPVRVREVPVRKEDLAALRDAYRREEMGPPRAFFGLGRAGLAGLCGVAAAAAVFLVVRQTPEEPGLRGDGAAPACELAFRGPEGPLETRVLPEGGERVVVPPATPISVTAKCLTAGTLVLVTSTSFQLAVPVEGGPGWFAVGEGSLFVAPETAGAEIVTRWALAPQEPSRLSFESLAALPWFQDVRVQAATR